MKQLISVPILLVATILLSFSVNPFNAAVAKPSGIFENLKGTWRGSGKIKLSGGNSQRISCRAYYNVKDRGAGLKFAIRCASPGNKIELRALLNDNNGRLSGSWEERTFNASGDVAGTARSGRVRLSISGAITGSMNISYSGKRQKVSISTAVEGLQGISINLRR